MQSVHQKQVPNSFSAERKADRETAQQRRWDERISWQPLGNLLRLLYILAGLGAQGDDPTLERLALVIWVERLDPKLWRLRQRRSRISAL